MKKTLGAVTLALMSVGAPALAWMEPQQSPRLERAKDYIADEQWARAIEQLKGAAADRNERNRDEALFWLAHSQHQASDLASAMQTISDLERQFATSRWVKPARSLRLEIAQKLRRNDVLWFTAQPDPRPAAPPPPVAPPSARAPRSAGGSTRRPPPTPAAPPTIVVAPAEVSSTARSGNTTRVLPSGEGSLSTIWIPEGWSPDTTLRIQALGSLMRTDAAKVIPILKEIALQSPDPNEASRAVFVLAQSGRPEAHTTVLDVARHGSESVQIAAVKELGRFGGADVPEQLLQVYRSGNPRVKYQIVTALGERRATTALMKIAESESDKRLLESAIVRLGQAGGREQLQRFYLRAKPEIKRPIIEGLFNARADEELIRIAEQERDQAVRNDVLVRLRWLGTPRARAYVEKQRENR